MAIEDMIRRIMDDARDEKQKNLSEAENTAVQVKKRSNHELEKEISFMERKLRREMINTRNIYISEGKRRARRVLLSSKEELIWKTIHEVRERMSGLSDKKLEDFLNPMVKKSSRMLGKNFLVYAVRERDSSVLSSIVKVKGKVHENVDPDGPLSRFHGVNLLGGFIAVTPSGNRLVDMTFHGLLERNEERIREVIAKKLFGEG